MTAISDATVDAWRKQLDGIVRQTLSEAQAKGCGLQVRLKVLPSGEVIWPGLEYVSPREGARKVEYH